jgi:hypothetical protein
MATKKRSPKKHAKKSRHRTSAKIKKSSKKKLARKNPAPRKRTALARKKSPRGKSQTISTVAFSSEGLGPRSGGQSGDLQGLSGIARAGSESVDELLEEGNAFEAELVKGVEDADDHDEAEVRTHEVPQDDVPGEYLDKD